MQVTTVQNRLFRRVKKQIEMVLVRKKGAANTTIRPPSLPKSLKRIFMFFVKKVRFEFLARSAGSESENQRLCLLFEFVRQHWIDLIYF